MDNISKFLAYIILLLFDINIIPAFRTALFDCFRKNGYNKSYKKISAKQSFLNRITLDYIPPLLKKYKSDFLIVHRSYKIYLVISILSNLVVPLVYFIFGEKIYLIFISLFVVLKFFIDLVIRIKLFPQGTNARSIFFIKG